MPVKDISGDSTDASMILKISSSCISLSIEGKIPLDNLIWRSGLSDVEIVVRILSDDSSITLVTQTKSPLRQVWRRNPTFSFFLQTEFSSWLAG